MGLGLLVTPGVSAAASFALLPLVLGALGPAIGLSDATLGLIASTELGGLALGTVLGALALRRFSRKQVTLWTLAALVAANLFSMAVGAASMLFVAWRLAGVATGVGEIRQPVELRGGRQAAVGAGASDPERGFSGRIYEDHPDYLQSPLIKDVMPPEYVALMATHPTDPMSNVREAVWHEVVEPVQDLMGFPADMSHKAIFHDMSKIGGENLRKLLNAGVLVAAGADAGEGESLLTELELIVADGGVTPVQAIEMATYNGARVLKKEKEFGSIQPNLIADLVLVKGDPSRNIRDVRNIEYVFKDGKIIDRASLTRQWGY